MSNSLNFKHKTKSKEPLVEDILAAGEDDFAEENDSIREIISLERSKNFWTDGIMLIIS